MTDYAPVGAINSLKVLGLISGTATTTNEESIGTINVGAGTFKAQDKIVGIITGDPTGIGPALRIRLNSNGVNVDLTPSVVSGVLNGFLYIAESHPVNNNEVIAFNVGARNATASSNSVTGDFNLANWITQAFTIEVRATGDATSGSYALKSTFYRLEGSA